MNTPFDPDVLDVNASRYERAADAAYALAKLCRRIDCEFSNEVRAKARFWEWAADGIRNRPETMLPHMTEPTTHA